MEEQKQTEQGSVGIETPPQKTFASGSEVPPTDTMDYQLEHLVFIEENDIQVAKIPVFIRKKMGIMKMLATKYKKTPTEANKKTMINNDITICDMLLTWKESDFADDVVAPISETKQTQEVVVETPPKKEVVVVTPTPKEVDVEGMEKAIRDNLDDNKRIKIPILKKIIGGNPKYPKQVVGNLTLEKGFLADYYKVI